jgi:hypothetical protein
VRRALPGALRQVREQLAHNADRGVIVGRHELAHAVAGVHAGAAELVDRDVLGRDLAHHAGPGEEHRRALGHHDEVGQGGRVGAAAR